MTISSSLPDSDTDEPCSESESEEDECTCGALDTGHRAHHPTCPMNPRNLIQNTASISIEPRLGDHNSQKIKPIMKGMKAGGPSSKASQKKSPSLATESKSPLFCLCRGIEREPMIACDSPGCPIEWFHFSCVGITEEPKGKWYCDGCASQQSVENSSTTVRK